MVRRKALIGSSLLTLITIGVLGLLLAMRPEIERTGMGEAIDGDSLRLSGEELRLRGIDAPELNQTCTVGGASDPCGRHARAALRRYLASGLATCIGEERDRFQRLLVVCRVRGIELNAAMVREGHAVAFGAYFAEEAEAKAGYRGMWAGTFQRPSDWRQQNGNGRAR